MQPPCTALTTIPTWRTLRRTCVRCDAPWHDGHVCDDATGYPRVRRFLDGLASLAQTKMPPELEPTDDAFRQALVDGDEVAWGMFGVAWDWLSLSSAERLVANAILDHAGVPPLDDDPAPI